MSRRWPAFSMGACSMADFDVPSSIMSKEHALLLQFRGWGTAGVPPLPQTMTRTALHLTGR